MVSMVWSPVGGGGVFITGYWVAISNCYLVALLLHVNQSSDGFPSDKAGCGRFATTVTLKVRLHQDLYRTTLGRAPRPILLAGQLEFIPSMRIYSTYMYRVVS